MIESFYFKGKKNKRNKFDISNNVKTITNRLYPKKVKQNNTEENKEKIIVINKESLMLMDDKNIFSKRKKISKKNKK